MKRVGARVTTTPAPVPGRKELPLIEGAFFDGTPSQVADWLWEEDIKEDCLVAVKVEDLRPGTRVRKAFGEVLYLRADESWLRSEWGVDEIEEDHRVLMIGDGGKLDLWAPTTVVVVSLSDLFGRLWSEIDYELGEMRSPR